MMKNSHSTILFYIVLVFSLLIGLYTVGSIANFFGISFEYYGVFMFLGLGLCFLYFILPSKHRNIFA
jgi:hypothetical protein